jgi:hypothetical protein
MRSTSLSSWDSLPGRPRGRVARRLPGGHYHLNRFAWMPMHVPTTDPIRDEPSFKEVIGE